MCIADCRFSLYECFWLLIHIMISPWNSLFTRFQASISFITIYDNVSDMIWSVIRVPSIRSFIIYKMKFLSIFFLPYTYPSFFSHTVSTRSSNPFPIMSLSPLGCICFDPHLSKACNQSCIFHNKQTFTWECHISPSELSLTLGVVKSIKHMMTSLEDEHCHWKCWSSTINRWTVMQMPVRNILYSLNIW